MKSQESRVFNAMPRAPGRAPDRSTASPSREQRIALGVELALLVVLVVFLGMATVGLFRMLDRLGISWVRGAPLGIAFVAAAYFTARKAVKSVFALRRGMPDGNSGE